jgi:hypothetical protein
MQGACAACPVRGFWHTVQAAAPQRPQGLASTLPVYALGQLGVSTPTMSAQPSASSVLRHNWAFMRLVCIFGAGFAPRRRVFATMASWGGGEGHTHRYGSIRRDRCGGLGGYGSSADWEFTGSSRVLAVIVEMGPDLLRLRRFGLAGDLPRQ